MADLAHLNMESNGSSGVPSLPFGSTGDGGELVKDAARLMNADKTENLIRQLSGFSGTLESVLLALLHNQDALEKSLLTCRQSCQDESAAAAARIEQEAKEREAADGELRTLIADGATKVTDDLTAQVQAIKSEVESLNEQQESNQKFATDSIDRLTNSLNDKIDSNLAEVVKLVNDESERLTGKADNAEADFKEELAALKTDVATVEGQLEARAKSDNDDHDRQMSELKMAIEEEKMLRGQDNEIVKMTLQQGVADLNNQVEEHKEKVKKTLEEDKDERTAQYDDLICRVDKERRERAKGLSDLETRLDEVSKNTSDKIADMAAEAKKETAACRDFCKEATEKVQTDLDALNTASIERLDEARADLITKIDDERKERADIIKDALTGIEGEITGVKNSIEREKQSLEESNQLLEEKSKKDVAALEDRVGNIFKGLCETVKEQIEERSTKLEGQIVEEVQARQKADEELFEEISKEKRAVLNELEGRIQSHEQASADIHSKVAAIEAQGVQGLEKVQEELQKEMTRIQAQEEALNGVLNASIPKYEAKLADLENLINVEKSERKFETEALKESAAKDKSVLQEALEKEYANVKDKLDQEAEKVLEKLSDETKALKTTIAKNFDDQKNELESLAGKVMSNHQELTSRLEDDNTVLKTLMGSNKDDTLNETKKLGDSIQSELNLIREQAEKDKSEVLGKIKTEEDNLMEDIHGRQKKLEDKLESETAALRNKIERENQDIKDVQARMESDLGSVRGSVDGLVKEATEPIISKIASLEVERRKKEEEIVGKIEECKTASGKEATDAIEKIAREIADTADELTAIKLSIESEKDNRRKEMANVRFALEENIKASEENSSTQNSNLKEYINSEMEERKRCCSEEAKMLKGTLAKADADLSAIKKDMDKSMDEERGRFQEKLSEVSGAMQETLKKDLEGVEDNVKKAKSEIRSFHDDLESKLKSQQEGLTDKILAEREELQTALDGEIARLDAESKNLKKTVASDKLELLRSVAGMEKSLEAETEDLKKQCSKLSHERQELQKECEAFEKENAQRKAESLELRSTLEADKNKMSAAISSSTDELRRWFDQELAKYKQASESHAEHLSKAKAELLSLAAENSSKLNSIEGSLSSLRQSSELPLSVCFNATREEAYMGGGEEYLTFGSCSLNVGGGMDAQSGVFTAPTEGIYLVTLNVCSHDMKKVLVAIRRNGEEIASVYDQNHTDNHRNSMAGQVCLTHLRVGDKVQVYMYTFTGIFDKAANHLTQFCGFLIRPTST